MENFPHVSRSIQSQSLEQKENPDTVRITVKSYTIFSKFLIYYYDLFLLELSDWK